MDNQDNNDAVLIESDSDGILVGIESCQNYDILIKSDKSNTDNDNIGDILFWELTGGERAHNSSAPTEANY